MQNIVRELYHGSYTAFEGPHIRKDQSAVIFARIENIEEKLQNTSENEQHSLLQDLSDAYMEYVDACSENEFINGYRFGVQMMLAAWPEGNLKDE